MTNMLSNKFSLNWNRWLKQNRRPLPSLSNITFIRLREIMRNLPLVMSQNCEMQG